MTQPPTITRSAITAAAIALWGDIHTNVKGFPNWCDGDDSDHQNAHHVAAAALTAAWPHLLQAIIDDAYDNDLAAGYAGDWLAHRYATILAALEES